MTKQQLMLTELTDSTCVCVVFMMVNFMISKANISVVERDVRMLEYSISTLNNLSLLAATLDPRKK